MALQTDTDFRGIPIAGAYVRVSMVTILPGNSRLEFQVAYSVRPDEAPFNVVGYSCTYDIEGDNPVAQAYTYLKTLPAFPSSIDC